ncbi:uncharacterized protein LOC115662453 [Syzygium oleosum]|uniref:uncharacterized protein LOC115662453 n=1 Tax=Syzygium oleosum TaxID=219896 RepID=UPI0024BB459C|nr:uncharacterized protein LOC115662453 [Syzygium oleosum]
MACMQEEAMKEKGSAVKSQEALLLPPRRGRIKRLVFACLFRSFKAPVAQLFGSVLGCSAPAADQKPSRSSSSLAPRWVSGGKMAVCCVVWCWFCFIRRLLRLAFDLSLYRYQLEVGSRSILVVAADGNSGNDLELVLVGEASGAGDADEALRIIAEKAGRRGGVVGMSDCCSIMAAALERGNAGLVLSVFYAPGPGEDGTYVDRWRWSRPDVRLYTLLVQGLAASLRVSDVLSVIDIICQVGVSPGADVPFGKVVRCPSCMIAVAVAQPQDGIQIVSCATCRYKYELFSGDIISIDSEEISMDVPAWKRGLRFLNLTKQTIPAAVHSVVVQTPSGVACTHWFATETATLPAQAGDRVTMALAAPSNVYREVGPFKFSPKAPNFYPSEPMCLTNHKDGRESLLLSAPAKDGNSLLFNPSVLFPLLAVLATGDAASGFIDPSLPQLLSVGAVASLTVGATLNVLVFPQLNRLLQRSVDATAIKQQLLSQYTVLQSRIKDLKQAAEKEV